MTDTVLLAGYVAVVASAAGFIVGVVVAGWARTRRDPHVHVPDWRHPQPDEFDLPPHTSAPQEGERA